MRRRQFLKRSCQGAAAWLLPEAPLMAQPAAGLSFHPLYREQTPLDGLRRKVDARLDDFSGEKEHDRLARIVAGWTAGLRDSPHRIGPIMAALAPDFEGVSPAAAASRVVRAGSSLEVRKVEFASSQSLGREAFAAQLQAALSSYSQILTAELQITGIEIRAERTIARIRYELVGTGPGFHREQRVGEWELEWAGDRVQRWRMAGETRSRAAAPWFAEISAHAFGANPSYARQMLHGVDYWRTILDGACGIDIYGHNGVSVGDIDGAGHDSVYVCQPAGLPNRLYRNRGDGIFEDVTEASGAGILENTACALFLDTGNTGRQDLVVVRANGPLLFLNEGGGRFRRKTGAFKFAHPPGGTFTGAAAADYNRDGLVDIYFCLYAYYHGADQYAYPSPYYAAENGPPNFLMRNNGDGTFRDVTAEAGLDRNNTRYSFCCAWNDYDGDGWPDLYVVNDFGRKNLYRNHRDGTFTDAAAETGSEDIGAGMSVSWLDYDNDGAPDLYVANMWTAAGARLSMQPEFQAGLPEPVRALYRKHAMGNSLLRNAGGRFEDATAASGAGMGRWSWSSDAWDFDHDGRSDLYVTNGMVSGAIRDDLNSFFWRQVVAKSPESARPEPAYEQGWNAINEMIREDYTWSGYERNVCFLNLGDGTFADVSGAVGLDFIEDSRSFALADFDGDGRQEMLLKNRSAPQLRLIRNIAQTLPQTIAFRLRGVQSNRDAIGAQVRMETSAGSQTKTLQAGSGFLSQHSKEIFFGLGAAAGPVKATIRWPNGLVQELHALPPGHRIWIEEGAAMPRMEPFRTPEATPHTASVRSGEPLPESAETWLLSPVPAPAWPPSATRGEAFLLQFHAPGSSPPSIAGVRTIGLQTSERDELAATYDILFRTVFDRHRDMPLPVSFLIDANGDVVKIYQGAVEPARVAEDLRGIPTTPSARLAKGLPFQGVSESYEFGRNLLSLGSAFYARGYLDQAAAAFNQAMREDPASAEASYGAGSVYLKQNKLGEARDSFERTTKLTASYPDTVPNAWNNLGLIATRENRMDDAAWLFREALNASPGYWIALENLGNVYRSQKRWESARATLERARDARPQDPEANYNLAMVYAQTGDSSKAYDSLIKALKLRPGYPEALNNLGILCLRTSRRDEAVAKFEECIRAAPDFDQAYLNLAQVYAIEGSSAKAREVLTALLKRHPGHPAAERALEELH